MEFETVSDLLQDHPEEPISTFAFNTGRLIEHIMVTTYGNALERNKELEGLILRFRGRLANYQIAEKDMLEEFDQHFNIEIVKEVNNG